MRSAAGGWARGEWTRRYPPLVGVLIALLLAIFALPSALNLPLANPGQSLEYAPVPGNNGQAPPGGNLAGLGLGQSGTVGSGGEGTTPATPPPLSLPNTNPPTSPKRCVGNPPRQTEDPASPPCVAFFDGPNGGSTYQGVTGTEVRVLFYFDGNEKFCCSSKGTETTPTNQYFDLQKASDCNQGLTWITQLCNWERYFNDRYQTYKRTVHFFAYFNAGPTTTGTLDTPEQRQADAADNYTTVKPFAVFDYGVATNWAVYQSAMVQHGVISFGGAFPPAPGELQSESNYQQFPKLIWGFAPAVEELARMYSSFICTKVAPYPVSFSGNNGVDNTPRVYGLLYTTDETVPELQVMWKAVVQQVQACGVTFKATHTFPVAGFAQNGVPPSNAAQDMADFQSKGVTTIIWPGGYETQHSNAAAKLSYYPEWITAGDYIGDGNTAAAFQDQKEWANNWVVTPQLEQNTNDEDADPDCYNAYTDAAGSFSSLDIPYACSFYENLRMAFTGIQVAGPQLSPNSIDKGFHAIPPAPGKTPSSPSCFFDAGDYTCLKNAVAEYWSPNGGPDQRPGDTGCYLMAAGAARYVSGQWPSGDVTKMKTPGDPCNQFSGSANITNRATPTA